MVSKCPKCKEGITYLKCWSLADVGQDFEINIILSADKVGKSERKIYPDYSGADIQIREKATFYCPFCNQKIANNETQAIKFLDNKNG